MTAQAKVTSVNILFRSIQRKDDKPPLDELLERLNLCEKRSEQFCDTVTHTVLMHATQHIQNNTWLNQLVNN